MYLTILFVSTILSHVYANDGNCIRRYAGQNSFVCVCNLTSCPPIEPAKLVPKGYIHQWTSSKDHYRLHLTEKSIDQIVQDPQSELKSSLIEIKLDTNDRQQSIFGFGGSISDATGFNLLNLPTALRDQIMIDFFSKNGLDYSMARVPMGGTDYSTRIYTYDDDHEDDFDLEYFKLQPEDKKMKIPMIKRALELRNGDLKLIASPWSPPAWMKTNNITCGYLKGSLGGRYYQTYANYFVKFLDAYAAEGINIWGLTTGNEPTIFDSGKAIYVCLVMSPYQIRDFIKINFGPTLEKHGYGKDKVKLLIIDDRRALLSNFSETILNDKGAASYVSGIAFHGYETNGKAHYENLNIVQDLFPDYFLLSTEFCEDVNNPGAELGNWTKAEGYAEDIINDLQRYTTGWIDWNLVLSTDGGPSWLGDGVDASILVNASIATYYRNPIFYSLGHFSKFLLPGSVHIGHEISGDTEGVSCVAFIDPNDQLVVVVLNTNDYPIDLLLKHFTNVSIPIQMDEHSIITLITPKSL